MHQGAQDQQLPRPSFQQVRRWESVMRRTYVSGGSFQRAIHSMQQGAQVLALSQVPLQTVYHGRLVALGVDAM